MQASYTISTRAPEAKGQGRNQLIFLGGQHDCH